MRNKKEALLKRMIGVVAVLLAMALGLVAVVLAVQNSSIAASADISQTTTQSQSTISQGGENSMDTQSQSQVQPESQPVSAQLTDEYRAMWISYLEWATVDCTSEATFRAGIQKIFDNCLNMGINTVITQVRPFGDALYKSTVYPWSHVLTGTQGQDPGYDPLAIMVEEAHSRQLKIEAWVNPYRVRLNSNNPVGGLADNNPAELHPDWTEEVNDGIYYNPAFPDVQQLVIDGVLEIVKNYEVDGVHLDDYFYPTTEESFDATEYALMGNGKSLADWRRENVNTLIRNLYAAIKQVRPGCTLGISPQGNNDNNYNSQYSDVSLWLSTPGYADYIMPQIYWGFDYLTQSGREDYQFAKLAQDWAYYPRAASVKLYVGLGAYRIGVGDGGYSDQTEWSNGENLKKMIEQCRNVEGISGFALYRYNNLFDNAEYPQLAQQEAAALTNLLKP
ncbi:MAG: family 10 glycosylhydrolase [Oscillospiraceae bacterium]|nr:family 10 glycosylhydrolase [Oscillospiraceae bacterium]